MANLDPTPINNPDTGVLSGFVAASGISGDTIPLTNVRGAAFLRIRNDDTGSPATVTIVGTGGCRYGTVHDNLVSVPASGEVDVYLDRRRYGNTVTVTTAALEVFLYAWSTEA